MMKGNWLFISIIIVLLASLVSCGQPEAETVTTTRTEVETATAKEVETATATETETETEVVKPIVLKFSTSAPPVHAAIGGTLNFMAEEFEKRTEGRVIMEIYWSSALNPMMEGFNSVVSGVADMCDSIAGWNAGRFPASEIADIPLGYPNAKVMTYAQNDWYNEFKPAEYDEVQMLFIIASPPVFIGTTDKPVRTLDDLKGLQIRTSGARGATMMEALGAIPKPMPLPAVYDALAKGVIDGVAVSIETYRGFKLEEVIKYATDLSEITWSTFIYHIINKDVWNKISSEDQATILDICKEATDLRAEISDSSYLSAIEDFRQMEGHEIIQLSSGEMDKLKAVGQDMIDLYISDMNNLGLPGEEYVNYIMERIDYWSAQ